MIPQEPWFHNHEYEKDFFVNYGIGKKIILIT